MPPLNSELSKPGLETPLRTRAAAAIVALRSACAIAVAVTLSLVQASGAPSGPADPISLVFDLGDMAYHRQGEAIVDDIAAGDFAAAAERIAVLGTMNKPQAVLVAGTHNAIGVAYGEAGRLESASVHLQEAIEVEDDTLPGLNSESRAYLAYAHAALNRFAEAERLLESRQTGWPWLFAKLAALYEDLGYYTCAVANGERALASGREGLPLAPYHAMGEVTDRDAVLRQWADRVEVARQAMRREGPAASELTVCLGGVAQDTAISAP